MFIDKNGKLFGKFNIVDTCVVLVIILSIVVSVYKVAGIGLNKKNTEEAEFVYTLKAKAIREMSCDAIEIGDEIYDAVSDIPLGKVISKRVEPAVEYVNRADGTFEEMKEIPSKYDLYFEVECDGIVTDKWYYLSGEKGITNYATLQIYTDKIEVSTTIMDIEINKK